MCVCAWKGSRSDVDEIVPLFFGADDDGTPGCTQVRFSLYKRIRCGCLSLRGVVNYIVMNGTLVRG